MKIVRNIEKPLIEHLKKKEITLITGPRQVGKTTLMKGMETFLKSHKENTLFLSLDFENSKQYFQSQENLLQKIRLEFGQAKGYIFIDEIQRKENAGLFLKGIYDMDLPYKFIISGSGSLELKEKIHESLAGRKLIFEVNPVSFPEFLNFKTEYKYENSLKLFFEVESGKSLGFLKEYLNFGGYPRVILEEKLKEKNRIINEIYSSYIEKDISSLLGINRNESYSTMIKLVSALTGKIINYSGLAQNTSISVSTLKNYLWYSEKTFILKKISPFFRNIKKEITKAPVYYFYDLGLRNYSIGQFGNLTQPDQISFVFQNFILNELQEKLAYTGKSIHFWRTTDKSEVDFIIRSGDDTIPVEVKFSNMNSPDIKRSLRSYIEKYKPKTAYMVNLNFSGEIMINSTVVKFIPYYDIFEITI